MITEFMDQHWSVFSNRFRDITGWPGAPEVADEFRICASWQFWAVLSAVFAALTAIFAEIDVEHQFRSRR